MDAKVGMVRRGAAVLMCLLVASPLVAQMQDRAPIEIPLRVDAGRLVVPVVASDGSELDFTITFGNVTTVLTESTAALIAEAPDLTLGGLPVPTDGFATIPDASLTAGGSSLAGMIAPDMLNRFDVLVDVPGGRLVLKPIGGAVQWEGMTLSDPIRLRVFHGVVLSLDIELDDRPFGAMLDLGTTKVIVSEGVQTASGIETEDQMTLALGSQTFADLPVTVMDLDVFGRFDPNGAGFTIIGAPLALDCAISVSWVHREMRTCVR
jgi:hypothetical protein